MQWATMKPIQGSPHEQEHEQQRQDRPPPTKTDTDGSTGTSTSTNDNSHQMIPIVDISPLLRADCSPEEREAVASEWDRAMRTVGLAVVVTARAQVPEHVVPSDAIEDLRRSATDFFHLPKEEKMEHCLDEGYGRGGYVPVGVEAVGRSSSSQEPDDDSDKPPPPDQVESLVFFHGADPARGERVVPSNPPSLRSAVAAYWSPMVRMLETLMKLSAVALGLPREYFDDVLGGYRYDLRLAYYPPMEAGGDGEEREGEGAGGRRMRYGAHTDYTGFTLLRQDPEASGLEVQLRSGEWIPVPPAIGGADSLVVNAGDLIQVWTNDRWRSPPHRVVQTPADGAGGDGDGGGAPERLSLVFFTGPADDVVIEALPTCVGEANPRRYEPISAGEHLRRKLEATTVHKHGA